MFGILWSQRMRLQRPQVKLALGFLYDPYAKKFWWFELA
jgi:hypothetical protein